MGAMESVHLEESAELGRGSADEVVLEDYARWFTQHSLSLVLRSDGGLWLCEAQGRHGDLPFSVRSGRHSTPSAALYECWLYARDHLRGEPYIMG